MAILERVVFVYWRETDGERFLIPYEVLLMPAQKQRDTGLQQLPVQPQETHRGKLPVATWQ